MEIKEEYKQFNGEPWKDENGWWQDLMIAECIHNVDVLIEGLQAWKEDAKKYYELKDNKLANKVNAGYESNMVYSKGPAINDLIVSFVKLGFIDKSKLEDHTVDYINRIEQSEREKE